MIRHRLPFVFVLAFLLEGLVTFAVSSCSKHHDDPVAASSQDLTLDASSTVQSASNTPSAVLSGRFLVVGYTATSARTKIDWAFAQTGSTTWSTCSVGNDNPSGCNGGSPTPMPGGVQTWIGKGAMAADGNGNVVYVVLGSSTATGTPVDLVAALVSTDDGHTFKASQIVNDGVPGTTCAASTEDLPDTTFDMTTNPPTLWVVWRDKSASSFGGCVRRGMLTPADGGGFTGGITWLDNAKSVGGMDRENDFDTSMGQGGMRIQAGDGVVTIGYSDNDELKTCTDTTLIPLTWETVSTFDNGQNWSNSSKVFHTDNFLSCPFGRLQNGNRAFDFLRANDGTYYFVAGDWASDGGAGGLHLFSSSSSSVIVNNTGSGTPTNFVWREWCPGFLDAPDGSAPDAGPATNWSPPGVPCPSGALATHQSYLLPTLVSDGTDRVGLLFYQGPNISLIRPVFEENLTPRLPSGSWQGITLAGSLSSPSGSVLLQHLSAVSSSPQAAEGCTAPGSFYAFFLTADGTTPTLRSTSIIP